MLMLTCALNHSISKVSHLQMFGQFLPKLQEPFEQVQLPLGPHCWHLLIVTLLRRCPGHRAIQRTTKNHTSAYLRIIFKSCCPPLRAFLDLDLEKELQPEESSFGSKKMHLIIRSDEQKGVRRVAKTIRANTFATRVVFTASECPLLTSSQGGGHYWNHAHW